MLRQILLCVFLFCGTVNANFETTASLRANVDGRDLGFFSWTNLMFSMGVCHNIPSTCPDSSNGMCKCPDCSKKLKPPHVKKYCDNLSYSSESGGGDSSYAAASSGYQQESLDTAAFGADASSRKRPWWWLLVAAAVITLGAGAYYARQRQLAAAAAKSEAGEKLVDRDLDYKPFEAETASNTGTEPMPEEPEPSAFDESVETADYTSMGDGPAPATTAAAAGAAGAGTALGASRASRSMSPSSSASGEGEIKRSRSWWQKIRNKSKSAVV